MSCVPPKMVITFPFPLNVRSKEPGCAEQTSKKKNESRSSGRSLLSIVFFSEDKCREKMHRCIENKIKVADRHARIFDGRQSLQGYCFRIFPGSIPCKDSMAGKSRMAFFIKIVLR